jgi:hypothetical protein
MNGSRWLVLAAALAMIGLATRAGTLTGAGVFEAGVEAKHLERLSVGLDGEMSERDVKLSDGGGELDLRGRDASVFIGADVLPWLAIFGTAGIGQGKLDEVEGYGTPRFEWSAGLNASIWHWEVTPKNPAWGLTLEAVGAFSQYESGESDNGIEWHEFSAALPLNYELYFPASPPGWADIDTLVFFAGPVYSNIRGTWTVNDFDSDFEESHSTGVLGGADLFFTDSLCFRGQVEYFDEFTFTASLRYHFR